MDKIYSVGIIGGGVSGVVTALELAKYEIDNILFEEKASVVNGPPFCHLHAGGNLYPDISDEQCRVLMRESIGMAKLFPDSIDKRPTFFSVPKTVKYTVEKIEQRLDMLVDYYEKLIEEDPTNELLGPPKKYYKAFTKSDLIELEKQPNFKQPNSLDEWMANAVKLIDYNQLKTPVFMVEEYGWNLFRLGAQAQLALKNTPKCNLKLNTTVTTITDCRTKGLDYNWEININKTVYKVKYLVNSCGFKTGEIEVPLNLNAERLIEFKAAYVSKWQPIEGLIPELIFHGERGTPKGMAQLTPYCDDYYQIHGMTKEITLFKNGLVKAKSKEEQPVFNDAINQKLQIGWSKEEADIRTTNAIDFVTKYVPKFKSATVGGPPLCGAQQIHGNDPDLRVGEVSFIGKFYARSEIIKASSALSVTNKIITKIQEDGVVPLIVKKFTDNLLLEAFSSEEIEELACQLSTDRGYPEAIARLLIDRE